MKTKQIPVLITLIAGLITCIISFIYQIKMMSFLTTLLLVIVIFYVLGSVVKVVVDKNFPLEQSEIEEKKEEEQKEEHKSE